MGRYWTGNSRAPWHDYRARHIYHITLLKRAEVPDFGSLARDWRLHSGTRGSSYVSASPIGKAVKDCLRNIGSIHPALRVLQYALMPDHLHILLSVESILDEILGRKLAAFKVMINKRTGFPCVFGKGFNDQILSFGRNLDTIYQYLRENPRRLAVRFANPDFFERRSNIRIGDTDCQAYGNLQLLENPFKDAVVVHRADSVKKREENRLRWLHTAANGGVIVSPFISKDEKAIRREAEDLGGRIIFLTNEPLKEREKPTAHDFSLCSEGRCLLIAPAEPLPFGRQTCLKLNSLAELISNFCSSSEL